MRPLRQIRLSHIATSLYQSVSQYVPLPSGNGVPFVIIGMNRSGTTLLTRLLDSHPQCVCMGELWQRRSTMWGGYYVGHRSKWSNLNFSTIAERALLSPQPPWVDAAGFKILASQPEHVAGWDEHKRVWSRLLCVDQLRVIRIHRNYVRCAVSESIARSNGRWIGKRTNNTVQLDPGRIVKNITWRAERDVWMDTALSQHRGVLDIQFEDMISDGATHESIQRHLGLPVKQLTTPTKRQNPTKLRDLIDNWDDVRKAIIEVGHARHLPTRSRPAYQL